MGGIKGHQYLVILRKRFFGYKQCFGPMYSYPRDARMDAHRNFGREGWSIEVKLWHKATVDEIEDARYRNDKARKTS